MEYAYAIYALIVLVLMFAIKDQDRFSLIISCINGTIFAVVAIAIIYDIARHATDGLAVIALPIYGVFLFILNAVLILVKSGISSLTAIVGKNRNHK